MRFTPQKLEDGWWFRHPLFGSYGPYKTRAEAREAWQGALRFQREEYQTTEKALPGFTGKKCLPGQLNLFET